MYIYTYTSYMYIYIYIKERNVHFYIIAAYQYSINQIVGKIKSIFTIL